MATLAALRSQGRFHRLGCVVILLGLAPLASLTAAADLEFAHGLYRQQRYQLAAEEYADVLKAQPNLLEARFYLAECQLQLGQTAPALTNFEAVGKGPATEKVVPIAKLRLGQLLVQQGDAGRAVPLLREATRQTKEPTQLASAHYLLAEAGLATGDLALAETSLAAAKQADQTGALADKLRFSQAKLADRRQKDDEALRLYDEIARSKDDAADQAQLAIGELQFRRQQYKEALAAFELLSTHAEFGPLARLNSGLCLSQLNREADATAIFASLLADPKAQSLHAEAGLRLAIGQYNQADYPASNKLLQSLIDRHASSPQAPMLQYYLALCRMQTAQAPQAVKDLTALLDQHPRFEWRDRAWHQLGRAGLAAQQPTIVQRAIDQLQKEFPNSPWLDRSRLTLGEMILADKAAKNRADRLDQLRRQVKDKEIADRLAYMTGAAAFDDQNWTRAQQVVEELLRRTPAEPINSDAQYLLGVALSKLGQGERAVEPLLSYARQTQDLASQRSALLAVGEALATHAKAPATAWNPLIELVDRRTDAADLYRRLADQTYAQKQWATAGRLYEKVIAKTESEKDRGQAQVGLGWCLFESGRFSEARGVFQQATAGKPSESATAAEAWCMAGLAAAKQGLTQEAIRDWQTLLDRAPASEHAFTGGMRLAALWAKEGQAESAAAVYERLLKQWHDGARRAEVLAEAGWLAVDADRYNQAARYFSDLRQTDPKHAEIGEAFLKMTEWATKQGDYSSAQRWLDQLVSGGAPPALAPTIAYRRGVLAYEQKQYDAAAAAFTELTKADPKHPLQAAGRYWLGEIRYDQQKFADAEQQYQQLVSQPQAAGKYFSAAQLRLAQCAFQRKDHERALQLSDAVLAGNPDASAAQEARFLQGQVLHRQAKFDLARQRLQQAVGEARNELAARAQFMIGETHFHQKDYKSALKELLKVEILYAHPQWQALALVEAGKCHEQLLEGKAAEQAYRQTLDKYPMTPAADEARQRLKVLGRE